MRILLGVCGSISAYKSIEVLRELIKDGHNVRVICTNGAEKFIRSELFSYLGAEQVYSHQSDFDFPHTISHKASSNVLHIELANWAQKFIIAPLSANTLARLVRAEASDLLSSVFLAYPQDKFISVFPAMNTHMLNHPFVQLNLEHLKKLQTLKNIYIDATDSGELACGDHGEGRLADVTKIAILGCLTNQGTKEKVLLNTGGTIAPLDPVRYLANPASGKTGFEIACELIKNGHPITVLKGHQADHRIDYLNYLPQVTVIETPTTQSMFSHVKELICEHQVYISSAAISDIEFCVSKEKLKKGQFEQGILEIRKAQDILSYVSKLQQKGLKTIGFAAETDLSEQVLEEKYQRKPVDLLIGTKVNNGLVSNTALEGFNQDSASYLIREANEYKSSKMSKKELASLIAKWVDNNALRAN